MTKGYMGKVLWVDLSNGTFNEEEISQDTYKKYLTGTGLGIHLLRREIKQEIDPLGEDNILGFCSGLLTGTGALFTGRWSVMGKSPLTNTYGDSNCGGTFAPALKRSGYDGIFFKGISSKPVYLFIDDKGPVLKSAAKLWGETDAIEAEEILLEEETTNGRKPACAVIGPSGEKLSLISGIVNDRGRIAARSGLGAVMGSKKLKAVVINSRRRVLVDQPELVKKLSRKCAKVVSQPVLPPKFGKVLARAGHKLRKLPFGVGFVGVGYKFILKQWGTSGMNQMSINWRDAPIKNWKGSHKDFPDKMSESINPDKIIKREKVKYHCHACPLGCGGLCSMEGRFSETHKPEYETILAFGGLNMNTDMESIYEFNELMNRAGMDTISAGATIAFACECYEKGLLTDEQLGGLDLEWGNTENLLRLAELMINREGLGDLLADGSKIAAEKIGKNTQSFAIHAGGQEPAMHDGRSDTGFNVHYSVEPAPGKHTNGSGLYYDLFELWKADKSLPGKKALFSKKEGYKVSDEASRKAVAMSSFMNVVNASGLCLFGVFLGPKTTPTFKWLNAVTGWDFTPEEYFEIGKRIQTEKQLFNISQGINPLDMRISKRAFGIENEPGEIRDNEGRSMDLDSMMKSYWETIGWDKQTGVPLGKTLEKLSIGEV